MQTYTKLQSIVDNCELNTEWIDETTGVLVVELKDDDYVVQKFKGSDLTVADNMFAYSAVGDPMRFYEVDCIVLRANDGTYWVREDDI